MDSFLLQSTIYLLAAVIAVPVATRIGLGSVLGYLIAGIAIAFLPGFGAHTEQLQHFAEFGVVMMLFLIGLELEPRALWDMRHKLIGLGGLQIAGTIALVALAGVALGLDWRAAFAVGIILAMSSTAIVMQTLAEKGLTTTQGGRSAFAVLLSQDIAVIPILALLPLLALAAGPPTDEASMSLVVGLPAWGVTLLTIGAVATVILAGMFLIRPLFNFIHTARLREMYTAVALMIVVGIAFLMTLVGLSPALGTFLAGVVLANSEFRHELEADIAPFKGLLLGLFFITVGAGIDFAALLAAPLAILALTLGAMLLKGVVLYFLARLFHHKGRDRWLFTLGLAQAGEFGFVLVALSKEQGVLNDGVGGVVLLIIALSMLLTPLAFILYEKIGAKFLETGPERQADTIDQQHPIIIAGIGRFGQIVNRLVMNSGFQTTVIDSDLEMINVLRAFGYKSFFGDPTRPDLLHSAGLATARVLVVALDDKGAALRLVSYARSIRPDLHIIARAYDRMHVFKLYRAGANKIVREVFDSSLRAGRYVLEHLGLTDFEAHEAERTFYQIDRAAMQELAQLWDPAVPITENAAYIERSKELNKELETALLGVVGKAREGEAAA